MSIQVVSDVHLEMFSSYDEVPPLKPGAPVVALLGDIGYPESDMYRRYVADAAKAFSRVLILTGNHEYYTTTLPAAEAAIRRIADEHANVCFLQKRAERFPELPGLVVLGCTLWAPFERELHGKAQHCVNDYKCIEAAPGTALTAADTNRLHDEHTAFLKAALAETEAAGLGAVVLTHHAPTDYHTFEDTENMDDVARAMRFSHSEELLLPPCVAWLFGHTHYNTDYYVRCEGEEEGAAASYTRVASNQLGYMKNYGVSEGYSDSKVIEFPVVPGSESHVVEYSSLAMRQYLRTSNFY